MKKCSEDLWSRWGSHSCSRNGVVERDGKWYCRQHDPEAVAARRAKRDAKWEEERIAVGREYRRISLRERIVDEVIRRATLGEQRCPLCGRGGAHTFDCPVGQLSAMEVQE